MSAYKVLSQSIVSATTNILLYKNSKRHIKSFCPSSITLIEIYFDVCYPRCYLISCILFLEDSKSYLVTLALVIYTNVYKDVHIYFLHTLAVTIWEWE